MSIAVFSGSFDPITWGHVDIVTRAIRLFDEVVVAIAANSSKSTLFSVTQRCEFATEATRHLDGVQVAAVPGLLVDFCHEIGADAIVRGLRGAADVDHETPMALMNRHIGDVETVFILGDPRWNHVASSLVKDVARHGGSSQDMVPAVVADALSAALSSRATVDAGEGE